MMLLATLTFLITAQQAAAVRVRDKFNLQPEEEDALSGREHNEWKISHVLELENPDNNVFTGCSAMAGKSALLCFQRVNRHGSMAKMMDLKVYSNDFRLIHATPDFVEGEDPRVLNSSIVFDNDQSNMHMIDVNTRQKYPVRMLDGTPAQGKNYVWFVHEGTLYAIAWFKPLTILSCVRIESPAELQCDHHFKAEGEDEDDSIRGGTVGYWASDGIFGFGRRTSGRNPYPKHDPFYWKLQGFGSRYKHPQLDIQFLHMPEPRHRVIDPTSLVRVKRKNYLITAESDIMWSFDTNQAFHNNVYEISGPNHWSTRSSVVKQEDDVWDFAWSNDDHSDETQNHSSFLSGTHLITNASGAVV